MHWGWDPQIGSCFGFYSTTAPELRDAKGLACKVGYRPEDCRPLTQKKNVFGHRICTSEDVQLSKPLF